jgi:hypothetical protein
MNPSSEITDPSELKESVHRRKLGKSKEKLREESLQKEFEDHK